MIATEALQIALLKKVDASEFYRKMANQHSEIRELFTELASIEQKHKKLIEDELLKFNK